jgi:hypothetical protein
LKLNNTYKGIAQASHEYGSTILFWIDMWNGRILHISYPHLFSFAKDIKVTARYALELERMEDLFHLPLPEEAYQEYCELEILMHSVQYSEENDTWSYIWGNGTYSSSKAYNHLLGFEEVHSVFKWV